MNRLYYLITITLIFSLASCVDLNIPPTTIITGETVYNEAGIKAYMAGMYRNLPMEDFKYSADNENGAVDGYFGELNVFTFWNSTGEMTNRNNAGFKRHRTGYWSQGFKIIRQANTLILDLPNYPELSEWSKGWIAEAKFIRAYVYFQLAKRYGGLPKVLEPQYLDPNDETKLWVKRESHADTYDFILNDLDDAIADMPPTSETGRANKYVAATLKSRAALYAATTARYGSYKFPDWEVDGILLEGIPENKAVDYFKQAWDAAKLLDGVYQLHRGNADKTANYAEVWEKCDGNTESIWLRKYDRTKIVHQYQPVMSPPRMTTTYGGRFNPTLDWVELFDGLPLNEDGHFSALDKDGNYIVYDNCQQLWNGVEPRLRANILIPGNLYMGGFKLDIRAGIIDRQYDPDVDKFKKISIDDGITICRYTYEWDNISYPVDPFTDGTIQHEPARAPLLQISLYDLDGNGNMAFKNGLDGPMLIAQGTNVVSTYTGFHGRKNLDITIPRSSIGLNTSTQPWIEMRYAEVLLNRAEAAIELAQSGEAMYNGVNMLQDAFTCINDVRDRAGARLLTGPEELSTAEAFTNWSNRPGPKGQGSFVEAPNRGLQIVRVERYKELAFESKIYWDLLRWFTFDTQIRVYLKRGLFPFMFAKGATVDADGIPNGKFIYDAKGCEYGYHQISFGVNNYYEGIPTADLRNNPQLQKNRFQ